MLQALLDVGVQPDLVIGTSVGALNGVFAAADPSPASILDLADAWKTIGSSEVFSGSLFGRIGTLARSGTHLHSNEPLRALLTDRLPVTEIEQLAVPFQCVAASIQQAKGHWFTAGPIVPAVLASAAVPGLLPPVAVGDRHYLDGGLVNSIPLGRAVELGARRVFVLQVGRIEQPLRAPRRPWEVAAVAFEIARRHRFARDMAGVPDGVEVHVLPVGAAVPRWDSRGALRYRDVGGVAHRIEGAYHATAEYLQVVSAR
jgi:NTE family protein